MDIKLLKVTEKERGKFMNLTVLIWTLSQADPESKIWLQEIF